MSVSVIIPAYNCEDTIEKTLDSVLHQTRYDLVDEIIIINDGSLDHTNEVIQAYMECHSNVPFLYLKQKNHGVSYTRNRAVKEAKGDWIALLDADDLWKPLKLEKQFEIIHSNREIKFLGSYPKIKFILAEKKGLCQLTARELCIRSMPLSSSVVFHRETGMRLGLFDEDMKYGEDFNFFQKFLLLDSYFVLAADLLETDVNKTYYGQSGLSSHLYQMHLGRNRNTKELFQMGLISRNYKNLMLFFNQIKFVRRVILQSFMKWKYKRSIRR